MQKKYHVSVSKHKARVKAKAQVHLRGDIEIQYSLLRDYANELQRLSSNIASSQKAPQTGRPPKNRKKNKGEIAMVKGHKLTRKGTIVTCSNCKCIGHNKRGCKGIGSSGGQMFDMPTREPVGSETMASQSVTSQHVASQTRSRGPVASELVASEHVASQTVGSEIMASQSVASQPVAIQTRSRGPVASEPVASQTVARKLVARKPVTRKPVQNKSVANKRAASQINEPASQASHSS
ncbi:hypothetical protein Tco_0943705 [Tanacetum coccineum]